MSAASARTKLERLCKWRSVFAAWQLGTRSASDPECQAVKDHREVTILLRAEVSAITGLLIRKGLLTPEEITEAFGDEAEMLSADYETRFRGIKATDAGIRYDTAVIQEHGTMDGWLP